MQGAGAIVSAFASAKCTHGMGELAGRFGAGSRSCRWSPLRADPVGLDKNSLRWDAARLQFVAAQVPQGHWRREHLSFRFIASFAVKSSFPCIQRPTPSRKAPSTGSRMSNVMR